MCGVVEDYCCCLGEVSRHVNGDKPLVSDVGFGVKNCWRSVDTIDEVQIVDLKLLKHFEFLYTFLAMPL